MNRLTKGKETQTLRLRSSYVAITDIDTIDNLLGDALRMFANTFSQIIGAVILISVNITT